MCIVVWFFGNVNLRCLWQRRILTYDEATKAQEEYEMFHENLKILRKEKGFSQEQLATRLNVVRQTVSKWEKGLSVPDAELLIKLSEVLNVEVSDLLGKNIEAGGERNDTEAIATELAKLNELLVVYGEKASQLKKNIGRCVGVILLVLFIAAIYEPWTEMWYEFGQNIAHMIND